MIYSVKKIKKLNEKIEVTCFKKGNLVWVDIDKKYRKIYPAKRFKGYVLQKTGNLYEIM